MDISRVRRRIHHSSAVHGDTGFSFGNSFAVPFTSLPFHHFPFPSLPFPFRSSSCLVPAVLLVSALAVFHVMRYINVPYLLTYLLLPLSGASPGLKMWGGQQAEHVGNRVKFQTWPTPIPAPKNSPDLHQSQEHPLAKVGCTCPPQSTPWWRPGLPAAR